MSTIPPVETAASVRRGPKPAPYSLLVNASALRPFSFDDGDRNSASTVATPVSVVNASVDSLARAGIRLVCWDFDLTVLRIHSFGERIEASAVPQRDMEADFRSLDFFVHVVRRLHARGVPVAIASFGRYEVIQAYMDTAFSLTPRQSSRIFTRENILTPSSVGSLDGYSLRDGKNGQLALLRETNSLAEADVLFFDDDLNNIQMAQEAGYKYAVHCPSGFDETSWSAASTAVCGVSFVAAGRAAAAASAAVAACSCASRANPHVAFEKKASSPASAGSSDKFHPDLATCSISSSNSSVGGLDGALARLEGDDGHPADGMR